MVEHKKPMSAKAYLSQALFIDQRIESKLDQVTKLRESAVHVSARLNGMPRSASPDIQPLENTIAKIIDLEYDINREIDGLVELKQEIFSVINQVQEMELQVILERRYLCYKTWRKIAAELNYDLRWVHRLHGRALTAVDSVLAQKRPP